MLATVTRPTSADLTSGLYEPNLKPMGALGGTLVQHFVLDMHRRGLAEGTIERRESAVCCLAAWLAPMGVALLRATPEHVQTFLDQRDIVARTRYHWLSHLHAFYEWAIKDNRTKVDPTAAIERPKLPPLLARPVTLPDLDLSLGAAGVQMHSWLRLGHLAGLRAGEVARMDRSWILDCDRQVRILGKGKKERIVPLHETAYDALRDWGLPRSGPVFVRPRGGPYPPAMISREVAVFLDGLSIDATFHCYRHRFGTELYRKTKDLLLVQRMMGHANIATTQGYVCFDTDTAADAIAML